jgi:3-oxoacyl-[acyl-carrier-protein] synthase II
MISSGDADIMICGGAEAPICSLGVAGFNACRALSTRNEDCKTASRPWDTGRDGFVLGEGAGILVLESEESAKKRGAKIYAEVAGFGMSSDAHHITMPHPEGKGAALSMNNALRDAGISADKIDYINAHGTSTPAGDLLEINAVKKVMGESVYDVAISSSKSMIGHLLGAAGAVEAIYSIKAINTNTVPPTINLNNVESACDGINLVPDSKQNKEVEYSMSNSFGFGGTNGTLIFKSAT